MAGADAYAGLMLTRKSVVFRNEFPNAPSVRDRGVGSNPLAPTKLSKKTHRIQSAGPLGFSRRTCRFKSSQKRRSRRDLTGERAASEAKRHAEGMPQGSVEDSVGLPGARPWESVATRQRGHQDLLDLGAERGVIARSIEHGRGRQLREAERRDHRVRLPVTAGRVIRDARPTKTSGVAA